jgi:4-hydroxy-4-methyl-2-oxoglutarate aldolase
MIDASTSVLPDGLSTPLIADACLQCGVPIRMAPAGIRAIRSGQAVYGRAYPVRHYGSVDVFLEALDVARPGDVLVIDNAGRVDESCVGDLTILETQLARLTGIVVWGLHRDTKELIEIDFPVFSYGTCAAGPQRLDQRDLQPGDPIPFGGETISQEDIVFGDDDGVLFVAANRVDEVLRAARSIHQKEREQANRIREGYSLRDQLQFADYLAQRQRDPAYSLRVHLKRINAAIEK